MYCNEELSNISHQSMGVNLQSDISKRVVRRLHHRCLSVVKMLTVDPRTVLHFEAKYPTLA